MEEEREEEREERENRKQGRRGEMSTSSKGEFIKVKRPKKRLQTVCIQSLPIMKHLGISNHEIEICKIIALRKVPR